jgi:hypothetical protein
MNPVDEARLRWASVVLEKRVLEVRDALRLDHLNCAPTSTVADIVETWDELCFRELLSEQDKTIGDILTQFDDKAESLEGDLSSLINQAVAAIMKHVDQLESLKTPPGDVIKKQIIKVAAVGDFKLSAPGEKEKKKEAAEKRKKIKDDLRAELSDVAQSLTGMVRIYEQNKEEEGGRKAAMMAIRSDDGSEALKKLKTLTQNDAFRAAAMGGIGADIKKAVVPLIKKLVTKIVPYASAIEDGWNMIKNAKKKSKKLMGIFAKFKKSAAPPEDKFAAFAKTVAKGPDKDLGEFADALQLDDDAEKLVDDNLEIKYIEDYVDKLRSMPPETPIADVDINDLITQWIKGQGLEDATLEVED